MGERADLICPACKTILPNGRTPWVEFPGGGLLVKPTVPGFNNESKHEEFEHARTENGTQDRINKTNRINNRDSGGICAGKSCCSC